VAPTQASDAAAPKAVAEVDASAPESPVPVGHATWKSVPRQQGGFYVALDGLCSKLGVGHVGADLVLYYGGTSIYTSERSGLASFIALKKDSFASIGAPRIESPTGVAGRSLDDFWLADSTGTRSSEGAVLHRFVNGAWKQYPKDQTNLHVWLDGGVIGQPGFAISNGEVWVEGSATKPPVNMSAGWGLGAQLAAFPTGEVAVIGSPGESGTLVARHWSKATSIKQYSLAMLGVVPFARIVEVSPTELYAMGDRKVAKYDGTGWKLLGAVKHASDITMAEGGAPGEIWVLLESGAVEHGTSAGFVNEAVPEPIATFDGFSKGSPWLVGKSGKIYARDGESWKSMPLPAPAFTVAATMKAKSVVVSGKDDVAFVAQYWESGLGWKERELHNTLIRSKPIDETLRCNEPDPENNNASIGVGFQSWPPMADAACTTPFVVLARRSNVKGTKVTDWPKLEAAFKGHAELGAVTLVEFTSGDRTFVGAKAKDLEAGKAMAKLAVGRDRVRPEVVCGDPTATRSIPLD
jgi:hypothetical protein